MSEWDSLETEAAAGSYRGGAKCHVGRMLAELPDEAVPHVRAALKNRSVSAAALANSLEQRLGERAPRAHSIGNHRRGGCTCREI